MLNQDLVLLSRRLHSFLNFYLINNTKLWPTFLNKLSNYLCNLSSVENIAEDVEQQKEDLADLDTKVDVTIGTVISIGDKVIEHDKEIGELGEGLEKIEERVDDVEEDVGETKIKVEEIDNKVNMIIYVRVSGICKSVIKTKSSSRPMQ